MSYPTARVEEIDGELVLNDPDAAAVLQVVQRENLRRTYELNKDRVAHFRARAKLLRVEPSEAVIVVLNVDDANGGALAEALMPGVDWQPIREMGEVPFARGIAMREGIQDALDVMAPNAAEVLRGFMGLAVVVVDHETAGIF